MTSVLMLIQLYRCYFLIYFYIPINIFILKYAYNKIREENLIKTGT